MKVIILAAGQGSRLRPLTDSRPKCMVEINGKSIVGRQIETMYACGIKEEDITIIAGYRSDVLKAQFADTAVRFIVNDAYETTNMVCSLMCAKGILETEDDVIISYGDIVYDEKVLRSILASEDRMAVAVDDGWYAYWAERSDNPLDDAETLKFDRDNYLTEIGLKTDELADIQAQYIGLMRFRGKGLKAVLGLCEEAKQRSDRGERLWRTERTYEKMYMTDLLQGLIDEGNRLRAVHIDRGWFEVDNPEDLKVAEKYLT